MTPIDVTNFLHSLAVFMAAGAGSLHYTSGSPRDLWIWQAVEDAGGDAVVKSADPYSVLVVYGGPGLVWDPQSRVSVQCMTIGTAEKKVATVARAQKLFESLLAADGIPLQMKQINALTIAGAADGHYRLVSVEFRQRPGLIGPDERNRQQAVFNFDVGFFKET